MYKKLFTKLSILSIMIALALLATSFGGYSQTSGYGQTLKTIKDRGTLNCGVNASNPGYSFLNEDGTYVGFEVDLCKALAAAVFNDPTNITYRPLTSKERFLALQTGEIDVLVRSATWTLTRDTDLSLNFTHPYFYDGQAFLVRKDSGIKKIEDLEGASIGVLTGSTSEANLADVMASRGIKYKPVLYESSDVLWGAYDSGRLDSLTTDGSSLATRMTTLKNPKEHIILDEIISKEPLASAVRNGDDQWYDIVQWTLYAIFFGAEHGITSANLDEVKANTKNPEIRRFLGLEGDLGNKLGLSNDWAYNIIKKVGNYDEIWNRYFGPGSGMEIPRGLNKNWAEGGLLFAPPFR